MKVLVVVVLLSVCAWQCYAGEPGAMDKAQLIPLGEQPQRIQLAEPAPVYPVYAGEPQVKEVSLFKESLLIPGRCVRWGANLTSRACYFVADSVLDQPARLAKATP